MNRSAAARAALVLCAFAWTACGGSRTSEDVQPGKVAAFAATTRMVTDLAPFVPAKCEESIAVDVNASGQALVWCMAGGVVTSTFVWNGARLQPLGPGFTAMRISPQGLIAGWVKGYPASVTPMDLDGDLRPDTWFIDGGGGLNKLLQVHVIAGFVQCVEPMKSVCYQPTRTAQPGALFLDGAGTLHVSSCEATGSANYRIPLGGKPEPVYPKNGVLFDGNARGDALYFEYFGGNAFVVPADATRSFPLGKDMWPERMGDGGDVFGSSEKSVFLISPRDVDGDGTLDYFLDASPADGVNDLAVFTKLPTDATGAPLQPLTGSFALNAARLGIFTVLDPTYAKIGCAPAAYAWSAGAAPTLIGPAVTLGLSARGTALLRYKDVYAATWDATAGISLELHDAAAALLGVDPATLRTSPEAFGGDRYVAGWMTGAGTKARSPVLWELAVVLPPAEQAQEIAGDIAVIVDAGQLTSGEGQALTAKLDAVQQSVAAGNPKSSCNQVHALQNQLEALKRSRRIDAATAAQLATQSEALATSLTCGK